MLQGLVGLFWTMAYLEIAYRGFRDKTYGMPIVALWGNITWEFYWVFVERPPGQTALMSTAQLVINVVWLSIDVLIVISVLRYGRREFPTLRASEFYALLILSGGFSALIQVILTRDFDRMLIVPVVFGSNLIMSGLFIAMLLARRSRRGQSMSIAATKLAGSALASIAVHFYAPPELFTATALLPVLYVGIFALDALYLVLLGAPGSRRFRRRQRPNGPDGGQLDGVRMTPASPDRTAVVVGAGVAGLVAARVLSRRFDRVVLLDRDAISDDTRSRRGVPQGRHAHGLLAVGREALEELFPGLTAELTDGHGGVQYDMGHVLIWHLGGFRAPFDSGVQVIGVSRPVLEWSIRRRVVGLANVALRSGVAVSGLLGSRHGTVTGVRLADGNAIEGQLVVDASGRSARSDGWLRALGFPEPTVSTIGVNLGYSTRLLDRRPGDGLDADVVAIAPTPPNGTRFGVAMAIEGSRWLVTLGGFHRDYPPADPLGYQSFAASLPHPLIANLLRRSRPLTEVETYRFPASRWRHFERLSDLPAGYLAIGDAVCSFNPVYGQGMTIAIASAMALGRALDRPGGGFGPALTRAFYKEATPGIGHAWELARAADFWHPRTVGKRPFALAFRNWYMRQVVLAAQSSVEVHRALIRVQHLLAPPHTLGRPRTVLATLRAARSATTRDAADDPVNSAGRPAS